MEFRLNKIEPEARQKVNEMTREGIIHSKSGLNISSYSRRFDGERRKKLKKPPEKFEFSNFLKKEKIYVEAVREKTIEIEAELEEKDSDLNYKGVFLDIRK
ncbi:hypothetical protein SAMN05444401_1084 [Clostridium amylolyticum]|uniref:Uncharacterized protein n=1 Tax=Clostridium amylolyticum TaxID=1121298 RepID=A0A1M6CD71_9CLOT|nr:hypothetical protein [Clostridium amylolyticum]SHI58947.1 hypothetical protein SAMN05444401_1084 [Clostridium amylolyticum]